MLTDFSIGNGIGLVLLADGMGGHDAGDVASTIVLTDVFRTLKLQAKTLLADPETVPQLLRDAAESANAALKAHMDKHPETVGMGTTLVAAVQIGAVLYWLSIGDSPLYLYRDGELKQINEDHSLAPQIDYMVRQGMLTAEAGRNHPDRSVLTSALHGERIRQMDGPEKPLALRAGDLVLASSDGLQTLDDMHIGHLLGEALDAGSAVLAQRLLKEVKAQEDPDQDNVSLALIRVSDGQGLARSTGVAAERSELLEPALANGNAAPELAAMRTADSEKPALFNRLYSMGAGLLK